MEEFIYAQIDTESKICVGVSYLSGEVKKDSMLRIDEETAQHCVGKRYIDGAWEKMTREPDPKPQPTSEELERAEILLTLQEILIHQQAQGGKEH